MVHSHTWKQEVLIHVLHQGCEIHTVHATGDARNVIPSREEQQDNNVEVTVLLQLDCMVSRYYIVSSEVFLFPSLDITSSCGSCFKQILLVCRVGCLHHACLN